MKSKSLRAVRVDLPMSEQESADFHIQKLGRRFGTWNKPRRTILSRRQHPGLLSFKGGVCSLPKLDDPPSLAWLSSCGLPRPCLECGTGHKNGNAFCSARCYGDWKAKSHGR